MNAIIAISDLRETYRTGTVRDLERKLSMYSYFLDKPTRVKIQKAIEKRKRSESGLSDEVKELIDALGWKVVDKR